MFSNSFSGIHNVNNDGSNVQPKVFVANTRETKRKSFIGKSASQPLLSAIPIKTFSVDF